MLDVSGTALTVAAPMLPSEPSQLAWNFVVSSRKACGYRTGENLVS
jgi:hypothetical protein